MMSCLPVHLAAALELRKKNELFLRAHKLVEEYPEKAVSWFAVGCYYFCIRNYDRYRMRNRLPANVVQCGMPGFASSRLIETQTALSWRMLRDIKARWMCCRTQCT